MLCVPKLEAALKLNPELPLGHYHLGFALASLGRNPDAIARSDRLHQVFIRYAKLRSQQHFSRDQLVCSG